LEGVLNEGDKVKVKLTGTDPKTGKFKLSRKVLLPKPEGQKEERPREGGDRSQGQRGERPRFEKRQDGGRQEERAKESGSQQGEQ
jgi:polyribonucleotide nucleotidyltransferase